MSFFSQLKNELKDQNIDKEKLKELTKKLPDEQPKAEEIQTKPKKSAETDPQYPDHPDYIALKPKLTERTLWNMPAVRFYLTLLGFCAGMILYGLINQFFDLGMTKGAVGWWQIIGAAIGFFFSREYYEPHLRIPFSQGTPQQKQQAVEAYLAQIQALDEQIAHLQSINTTGHTAESDIPSVEVLEETSE